MFSHHFVAAVIAVNMWASDAEEIIFSDISASGIAEFSKWKRDEKSASQQGTKLRSTYDSLFDVPYFQHIEYCPVNPVDPIGAPEHKAAVENMHGSV